MVLMIDKLVLIMQKHTRVYLDFFGYDQSDTIYCEMCNAVAVDVHHLEKRNKTIMPTKAPTETYFINWVFVKFSNLPKNLPKGVFLNNFFLFTFHILFQFVLAFNMLQFYHWNRQKQSFCLK